MSRGSTLNVLFKVLGRRVFLSFGLVSCLVVFLLAAVTVTSRYAMQRYVADQIERVPWDLSIYQTAEVPLAGKLRDAVAEGADVAASERLYFLRTIPPYSVKPLIDGQQLRSPWLSLLTATDSSLLPPDIRPTSGGAVVVLVGSKNQMGDAFLRMQNRKRFELVVQPSKEDAEIDAEHRHALGIITVSAAIERVIRIDSTELNRWFLEQTSSPTLVPELGMILVADWDPELILDFDAVSRGFVHDHGHTDIHGSPGEYFPEIIHLARLDRTALVSGWDIEGSLQRIITAGSRLTDNVQEITASAAVDHNLGTMFIRMNDIARRIALISLLVSLPLLLMAGILLGNLANLLLLNERRKLGLLRLRGVPGTAIGRTLLLAIGLGGLVGGVLGAVLGTMVPLVIYFGRLPPLQLIPKIQEPLYLAVFLVVGIGIALWTGRRLIAEASRVSPLEASRRVAQTDADSGRVRFGVLQFLALMLGGAKVIGWVGGWTLTDLWARPWVSDVDRALDFVSFPLFIYGLVTLLASRQRLMSALMAPAVWLMAGPLRELSQHHMTIRRHRAASFLLIVALMTTLALYPTVMTAVFDEKTARGAEVQLGGDMQITLNALDLMPPEAQARGGLKQRSAILRERLDPVVAKLRGLPQVRGVTYMIEGLVEGLYMPDRGFSGLPIYLIGDVGRYLDTVYFEPVLGESASFAPLMRRLDDGRVLGSSSVGTFYKRAIDQPMPVGRTTAARLERAPYGGAVRFLPGVPLRTVNDREGFVSARVDYLNHLFSNSPYLIGSASNPAFADLDVLIPRVVLAIAGSAQTTPADLKRAVLASLDVQPLDLRDTETEIGRLGSDMYIFLARDRKSVV